MNEKEIKKPTTYSITNIVEELEKLKSNLGFGGTLQTMYADNKIDKAIEIVKHVDMSNNVCEWKIFDNSLTNEPQWVYETTCRKYVGEEHTSKAFVYCPYCGKKIKVVE